MISTPNCSSDENRVQFQFITACLFHLYERDEIIEIQDIKTQFTGTTFDDWTLDIELNICYQVEENKYRDARLAAQCSYLDDFKVNVEFYFFPKELVKAKKVALH